MREKKLALISVSDKTGIVEFAKALNKNNYQIISTGGTYNVLKENDIDVISIESYSGFDEIMDGRVKTLQPIIHAGLLGLRDEQEHIEVMKANNWRFIDLVCVNLYPFEQVSSNKESSFEHVIENIDIGGPSMLRSAAKNFKDVFVVTNVSDYDAVIANLATDNFEFRKELAKKAFLRCSLYNAAIANYLEDEKYPTTIVQSYSLKQDLRYGENSHQSAKLYSANDNEYASLVNSKQLHGKELSYNNMIDANAALEIISEFKDSKPTALALKHTNPCGVASSDSVHEAFLRCKASDPISIFGGIVAFNCEVDEATAKSLNEIFLEIVIAPSFSDEALGELQKKKNLRIIEIADYNFNENELKQVSIHGGLLMSDYDNLRIENENFDVVTNHEISQTEKDAMIFAQKVCKHVKSNAIVICSNEQVLGVGAGQMNRISSLEIALNHALENHADKMDAAVIASDAFFPFDDCAKLAAKHNIKYIIQPGGSIRDKDSIKVCNENNIKMVFTNARHFKH